MELSYRKLQKIVNKINYPNGIHLEFGTEIMVDNEDSIVIFMSENNGRMKEYFRVAEKNNLDTKVDFKKSVGVYSNDYYVPKVRCKILGSPLTLQDILRAIYKKYENEAYRDMNLDMIWGDEYIEIEASSSTGKFNYFLIKIYLSRPISSQSEETINQLIELLS